MKRRYAKTNRKQFLSHKTDFNRLHQIPVPIFIIPFVFACRAQALLTAVSFLFEQTRPDAEIRTRDPTRSPFFARQMVPVVRAGLLMEHDTHFTERLSRKALDSAPLGPRGPRSPVGHARCIFAPRQRDGGGSISRTPKRRAANRVVLIEPSKSFARDPGRYWHWVAGEGCSGAGAVHRAGARGGFRERQAHSAEPSGSKISHGTTKLFSPYLTSSGAHMR